MGVNELSWEWRCRFSGLVHSVTRWKTFSGNDNGHMFSYTSSPGFCPQRWENVKYMRLIQTVGAALWLDAFHRTKWIWTSLSVRCVEGWRSLFNSECVFLFSVQGPAVQSGGVWIRRLHLAYWSVLQKQGTSNSVSPASWSKCCLSPDETDRDRSPSCPSPAPGSPLLPQEEPKKVRFDYDLFLHLEGHPPVNHLRCEKLTFNNPTEEFRRKLLKAGGVGVRGGEAGAWVTFLNVIQQLLLQLPRRKIFRFFRGHQV